MGMFGVPCPYCKELIGFKFDHVQIEPPLKRTRGSQDRAGQPDNLGIGVAVDAERGENSQCHPSPRQLLDVE